jgi:hypothetical protein
MGVDPLSVGLAVGLGGLGAIQTNQSNKAANYAAAQQKAANEIAANAEKDKLAREFAALEGTLRATSAGRGVAGSQTASALSLSAGQAGIVQQGNVNTNLRLANVQADQRAAAAQQSPFMSLLMGGIQGYMLGGQLSSTFNTGSIFKSTAKPNLALAPNSSAGLPGFNPSVYA